MGAKVSAGGGDCVFRLQKAEHAALRAEDDPIAGRVDFDRDVFTVEARAEQDSRIYESVKTALLACLRGYNPKIALEFARKTLPSNVRPAFSDFEQHLKTVK